MYNKILCIDDDPITLMLCKKVISKAGFSNNIDTVLNGEEAINYFKKIKENNDKLPEIVFLDLNMPVMDGWDFLETLSSNECCKIIFKDIKIIILSSTIDPKDIEKAKKYPEVHHFFSKPITKEMLEHIK